MNNRKASKGKGKAKNYNSKAKKGQECEREDDEVNIGKNTVRTNNPQWYSPNAQLVKDVASFPYGVALGNRIHYGSDSVVSYMNNASMPGILRVNFCPTMGWSDSPNSPLNIVGKNLYTFIRSANSGARNYDYPDLMLYYIAMDSAYSYLSFLRRIYGLLGTTNYMNRYYPEAIVQAAGGKYFDLVGNMADFRAYINMYALKLQSYVMPAHASYFARHDWMLNNVFSDTGLGKDQTYVFTPVGFYQFGLDKDKAGTCSLVTFGAYETASGLTNGSFEFFRSYGDALLDAIVGSPGAEDFNTISGDILKAYGDNGVVRAEIIADNYSIVPIVDAEALSQIQNATAMGTVSVSFMQSISKDYLISTPRSIKTWSNKVTKAAATRKADLATVDRFVNLYKDNPSPEDTLVATRLTVVPTVEFVDSENRAFLNYQGCGSEIVTSFQYYYFGVNATSGKWQVGNSGILDSFPVTVLNIADGTVVVDGTMNASVVNGHIYEMMAQFSHLSAFRYHPYQIYSCVTYDNGEDAIVNTSQTPVFYGDTSNYALLDDDSLRAMHETALLAQLGFENYRNVSKK